MHLFKFSKNPPHFPSSVTWRSPLSTNSNSRPLIIWKLLRDHLSCIWLVSVVHLNNPQWPPMQEPLSYMCFLCCYALDTLLLLSKLSLVWHPHVVCLPVEQWLNLGNIVPASSYELQSPFVSQKLIHLYWYGSFWHIVFHLESPLAADI